MTELTDDSALDVDGWPGFIEVDVPPLESKRTLALMQAEVLDRRRPRRILLS